MKYVHLVAFSLLLIGGLNWGIFALTGWDIGQLLGGPDSMAAKAVYVLVGVSALYIALEHKKTCKVCSGTMDKPTTAAS